MGYAKKLMPEDFPEHWNESVKALRQRYGTSFNVIQRWRGELGHPSVRKRRVMQYNLDGTLLAVWDSVTDAGRAMYVSYTAISQCCKGKSKTSCGYVWKFADEAEGVP